MIRSKCLRVVLALIAPVVMFSPQVAWSLGLGEIEVDSALNEKFAASITLSEARDLQESEIVVSLASREDFERVGVERFHFLTSLDFEIDVSGPDPIVRLSSTQPISEPYLNFIVEVLWPKGRLLKEFTVLLDPPTFSAAAAPKVVAPVETITERAQSPATQPRQAPTRVALDRQPAVTPSPRPRDGQTGEILTTTDDTLWKIANRTRAGEVNVNQQMLAIQDLNPRAFIRNNINLLKAGYNLALPTEEQALALSTNQAQAAVSEQTNAWRNPSDLPSQPAQQQVASSDTLQSQVDATPETQQEVVQVASEQGQVRIVAASGELVQGGAEASPESGQLIEENETLNRQVDELKYQLDREQELASNQVELKSRELEVKDQELAALQNRLEELEKEMTSRQQNQATPTQAEAVPIWQSPLVLGGIIGVLVLLLAFVLLKNRRTDEDEEDYDARYEDEDIDDTDAYADNSSAIEPSIGHEESESVEADVGQDKESYEDDLLDGLDVDDVEDESQAPDVVAENDGNAETSDVIGEADIYVAYGRHGQAVSLLVGALNQEPNRHDVRLKLLEVCVDAEDPGLFSEHADYLVDNCDDEDILLACRDLEARLNDQVSVLEESEGEDSPSSADEVSDEFELEDEEDILSVDELAETPTDGSDEVTKEDEFELEFDADEASSTVGDVSEPDEIEETSEKSDDEEISLGGDLGIDFDPDQNEDESSGSESLDLSELDALEAAEDDRNAPAGQEHEDAIEVDTDESEMEDFEFEAEGDADINATKIDLAEAYIDMGDGDGARDILNEVLGEGTPEQQARAQELLSSIDK
ncbi:MAG: hypothetical protein GKR90_04475 [Pseudomonadales bacterium]|nr:hypothetical protein [Pseudomonadales bacterium]